MLLVIYLKTIFKDPSQSVGNKFLALVLLNSLMRTRNQFLLSAVEAKLLRRLYIIISSQKGNKRGNDFSQTRSIDRKCAEMFQHLLR